MYQTILLKAPGRRSNSPVVILNALSLGCKCSTSILRRAAWLGRCALRAAFGFTGSMMALGAVSLAAWLHALTVADATVAGRCIAADALLLAPWGIVWTVRATLADFKAAKKGGKA